jgi:hypothetical protein
MLDPLMAEFLKDFARELYHRAAVAKGRDERMAIKGVQHSLERALERYAIGSFERAVELNRPIPVENDDARMASD